MPILHLVQERPRDHKRDRAGEGDLSRRLQRLGVTGPCPDTGQALRRYGRRIREISITIMIVEMNETTVGA
jgi:hypothetical protein